MKLENGVSTDDTLPRTEKGHGRIETRQYFLSMEISDFISQDEWNGLAAIDTFKKNNKCVLNNSKVAILR